MWLRSSPLCTLPRLSIWARPNGATIWQNGYGHPRYSCYVLLAEAFRRCTFAERGRMGEKLSRRKRASEVVPVVAPSAIDLDATRELCARITDEKRLGFARALTAALVRTLCQARGLSPPTCPGALASIAPPPEATAMVEEFGATIAGADLARAAYLIGTIYGMALPSAHRASHGIFYTPPELAEQLLVMAEDAGVTWDTARVLDPACGGGAFLLPILRRMINSMEGAAPAFILQQIATRLRGFDIDPFGAWLAQAMCEIVIQPLTETARRSAPKIVDTRDALDIRSIDRGGYDLVIGNPPYGRVSLPAERRRFFARSVYGHANLYGLFTDAALHWARRGGVVGYVTPTSMLSGLYFKSLRELLAAEAPPLAVNFVASRNGVFADVLQETMLATYRRDGFARGGKVGCIEIGADAGLTLRKTGTIALPTRGTAPWLLARSPEQATLTRRLRAMPHRLRDYGYRVSTGPLVWNRFKSQFRLEPSAASYPVIWAESVTSDGRFIWRSEKRNHAPWFAANRPKDDWLIVTRPCVLVQRTTAKEQSRRLIAAELPERFVRRSKGVAVENHLNMVWPIGESSRFPAAVIATLLNSAAVDEAFRCINGSTAVSAFELEELPLPPPLVVERVAELIASRAPVEKIEAVITAAYARDNASAAA